MSGDDAAIATIGRPSTHPSGDFHLHENVDARLKFQHDVHLSDTQENRSCSCGPCMLPLLPVHAVQDCSSSLPVVFNGTASRGSTGSSSLPVVFNGTASRGSTGPPVGAVDIGISKSSYYFRVALPGVKKDPGEFSCEVERNGKVHVRGATTTGATTVSRFCGDYTMKFQQQCPPGPFTLSFCLPGPVDPRLFSPNFRSDGIFEGVIVKNE